MKQITEFDCGRVVAYRDGGMPLRSIEKVTSIPKSTITRCLKNIEQRGEFGRKRGSGRPPLLNKIDMYNIERICKRNPKLSAHKLNNIFYQKHNKKISNNTFRRTLNNLNLYAFVPSRKPLMSATNIANRKNLCKKFIYKPDIYWESVIFSDECKFNLYNSDGVSYIWREPGKELDPKYVNKTVKYGGGNVMVWGCFSSKGMGKLVFIDDTMDQWVYLNILKNNLNESASLMGLESFIFQQDNDPKHTSKVITEYLEQEKIPVLAWPSQSPDLNPIEHIWAYMKKELCGKNYRSKPDLKIKLLDIWNNIPKKLIDNLIKSIPKRQINVLKSKGKYSKY
jgi:transposase